MSQKKQILSDAEISAFCQQIGMIIKAGLPTYYGISILRDEASDEHTKEFLNSIYEPMEKGIPQWSRDPVFMMHCPLPVFSLNTCSK